MTPKRERFCREFLIDLNGTKAAVRAGYAESGAHTEACRLLKDAEIQARIEALQGELAQRTDCSADDVVTMLLQSFQEAREARQFGPAVRAAELLGKRLGLFIDVQRQDEPANPEQVRERIGILLREHPELAALMPEGNRIPN